EPTPSYQAQQDPSGHVQCLTQARRWTRPEASARLREAEVDLRGGRVGPARGDDLAAGVEVDAFGAVDMGVAEEAVLPAAEGVVGDRHRNRYVDPDHSRLDVELELPGDAAVARED